MAAATASMAGDKAAKEAEDFGDAVAWVQQKTGDRYPGDLWEYLKTGQTLCKLVNSCRAGIVTKVNGPGLPFKEMENITFYTDACTTLGVKPGNIFRVPDLYEKRSSYPKAIIQNILALKKVVTGGSSGPSVVSPVVKSPSFGSPTPAKSPTPAPVAPVTKAASFSVSPTRAPPVQEHLKRDVERVQAEYDAEVENNRRREAAKVSSSAAGDAAKSGQEAEDYRAAVEWTTKVTGKAWVNGDLWETCKSGDYLCELANRVKPGVIAKYNKGSDAPFKCMENMTFYISACEQCGVKPGQLFRPPDLYEKRVSYPKTIIDNFHALAKVAAKLNPSLPKMNVNIVSVSSGKYT